MHDNCDAYCIWYIVMVTYDKDQENDFDHAKTIRQHYMFLVDHLDVKHSGLVGELYQAGVLNREERDGINSEVTSFTQDERLLSILGHKTKNQFDKFLDALDRTGQRHVHNHITGRQGKLFDDNDISVLTTVKTRLFCAYFISTETNIRRVNPPPTLY